MDFSAKTCGWSDLQQGRIGASPGSFLTAASTLSFFTVERRPLPPLASVTVSSGWRQMVFNLQATMPFRRPSGSSAAGSRLSAPSGVVPGGVEVGGAEFQFDRGGDGAGLDRVFLLYFEVLGANCKGLCVLFCFIEALFVRCNSTDEMQ